MTERDGRERKRTALLAVAVILAVAGGLLLLFEVPGSSVTNGAPPEVEEPPVEALPPSPEKPDAEAPPTPGARAAVSEPDEAPPVRPHVRLEVELVDARTGLPLSGATIAVKSGMDVPRPLEPEGDLYLQHESKLIRGRNQTFTIRIEPPTGYAVYPTDAEISGRISRLADRVRFRIPARPAISLRVQVVSGDARPLAGAEVELVKLGRRIVSKGPRVTGADGVARFDGIPLVPGEKIVAGARLDERRGLSDPRILGHDLTVESVRVVLPDAPGGDRLKFRDPFGRGAIGGGSAEASFGFVPDGDLGSLTVRAVRRGGQPAVGVRVKAWHEWFGPLFALTDSDGLATFEELVPGTNHLCVDDPGFLMFAPELVEVGWGERSHHQITEPAGCTTDVLVTDAEGIPAPYARLTVLLGFGRYALVEGDLQHLVLLTDAQGRATVYDLPPSGVEIMARHGSRGVKRKAAPGEILRLTLSR